MPPAKIRSAPHKEPKGLPVRQGSPLYPLLHARTLCADRYSKRQEEPRLSEMPMWFNGEGQDHQDYARDRVGNTLSTVLNMSSHHAHPHSNMDHRLFPEKPSTPPFLIPFTHKSQKEIQEEKYAEALEMLKRKAVRRWKIERINNFPPPRFAPPADYSYGPEDFELADDFDRIIFLPWRKSFLPGIGVTTSPSVWLPLEASRLHDKISDCLLIVNSSASRRTGTWQPGRHQNRSKSNGHTI